MEPTPPHYCPPAASPPPFYGPGRPRDDPWFYPEMSDPLFGSSWEGAPPLSPHCLWHMADLNPDVCFGVIMNTTHFHKQKHPGLDHKL